MQPASARDMQPALALLEKTPRLLETMLCDLPGELLHWKPAPERWSISEVLAHLSALRAGVRGARAADGCRGISRADEVRSGGSRAAGRVFARIGGRKSGAIYAHAAFDARSTCGIAGIRQRSHRGAFGAWNHHAQRNAQ